MTGWPSRARHLSLSRQINRLQVPHQDLSRQLCDHALVIQTLCGSDRAHLTLVLYPF
jgi:hypothetical protein